MGHVTIVNSDIEEARRIEAVKTPLVSEVNTNFTN
jgi:hypothetical protein